MISVLAKKAQARRRRLAREPPLFFVLRQGANDGNSNDGRGAKPVRARTPATAPAPAIRRLRKIRTSGIRSAYVADFDVEGYEFPETDIVCRGRDAWEAVFATVNLGQVLPRVRLDRHVRACLRRRRGAHRGRILYGKRVAEMPHIRSAMAHAYAKLTAMKLFAYRRWTTCTPPSPTTAATCCSPRCRRRR